LVLVLTFTCGVCLQGQAIDMVLTDYCMPEMTGYDLLKAIKVHIARCCIIFFTFVLCYLNFLLQVHNFSEYFQAMSSLKPIPVIVMSSENEPQRISR
jgi:two-component response regulator (ARR-A family)